MIQHLSKKHTVTVISIVRSEEEALEGAGIESYCNKYVMIKLNNIISWLRTILNLLTAKPSSFGYFYSPHMKRTIQYEVNNYKYDLIFVHCSSVAGYVATIDSIPKILDFGDMDSQKWLDYSQYKAFPFSLGFKLEGIKLESEEKKLARCFTCSSCTTKAELKTLVSFNAAKNTYWFPNGVDSEYFSPSGEDYKNNSICFIGRMDYYPNQECMIDFCNNILPRIQEKVPEATLTIVGANPSNKIVQLSNLKGVVVTGSVDDVRPYVRESAVNVAPLNIARGTQNKILESMAMGVPVVASKTAAGGIDAVPGKHFLVATNPEEYVEKIIMLFFEPDTRKKFSKMGRERVVTHHNWETSMQSLDRLIADCLNYYSG
jgi:sugar transferase (PEP-CTERM/EpsH1 system associated)